MSSCIMKNPDSDEEVDLEALRLAALKSRKPKYPRVNHNNLIPIVPVAVAVESPDFVNTKIKLEKVSPSKEVNLQDEKKNKENDDEKASNYSELNLENDQDILSMDDKEEEDSLERLMDQLEAEISGKAPISTNRIVLASKKLPGGKNTSKKSDKEGFDDEIELVQVKTGKEPNAVIEIRESASPEPNLRGTAGRKSLSPKLSPSRRSRSKLRSRSRSPFLRERSYRRSRSPYWSRSPRRSRSPFRRSRSPYWSSRWTRSKSRSPFRRYRSPLRKRSPFSRFSRSRSISYGRRSPWSLSPRRRSKSPFYHDGLLPRYRSFNSPRRSFSPRKGSKSPRRRSRSPRRYFRNSPYRISKSPFRRSRSPFRRTPRRSQSPFLHRSKSPLRKLNSPNRSPMGKRYSKSPCRRSLPKSSDKSPHKTRSKSPVKRYEANRSPGRLKEGRSLSISGSPTPRRNRSPLKTVEKNKLDGHEKSEKPRARNEMRHRSLSRENRNYDRRSYRQKYGRKFSPTKSRKSKSPKPKVTSEKGGEETAKQEEKEPSPSRAVPLDPVLEARKKKFENLGEVDPTVDKKISLKAIKESTENMEEDEDALTINLESNLWDESEESEDEFESRFKSDGARKNRVGNSNRTVLSFRNLRDGDAANKKVILNKPLVEENRRDRFRRERHDAWLQGRRNERNERKRKYEGRSEEKDATKNKSRGSEKTTSSSNSKPEKKSDRKPIVWSSKNERKPEPEPKDNEVSTTQSEVKENKSKSSERTFSGGRDKLGRNDSNVHEADDFDKLISDFEKELESDLCVSTKEANSTVSTEQSEAKRPKISTKKDLSEPRVEPTVKKQIPRIVKISEATSNKIDKIEKSCELKNPSKLLDVVEKVEVEETQQMNDGPEDYIEDDDFVLEVSAARKQKSKGEEEDNQSDLRAVLSRRRNERLTKAVSLQENMPTRLVQSAFQGLGNKKSKRQIREVQDTAEFASADKNAGAEGRRVLLLHREKNPIPSLKCTVPEVKPDTTIHRRYTRSNPRRKRKLHRQLDTIEDVEQEEEEQEEFEVEEEKQFRRFRLKRNVTLSSQFGCFSCRHACPTPPQSSTYFNDFTSSVQSPTDNI